MTDERGLRMKVESRSVLAHGAALVLSATLALFSWGMLASAAPAYAADADGVSAAAQADASDASAGTAAGGSAAGAGEEAGQVPVADAPAAADAGASAAANDAAGDSATEDAAVADAADEDAANTVAAEAPPASVDADATSEGADVATMAATADTADSAAGTAAADTAAAAAAASATTATTASKTSANTAATELATGWYTVKTLQNGALVLQVKGSSAKKGTAIVLSGENRTTGQAFQIERLKSGYYRILAGTGLGSRIYVSSKGAVSIATSSKGRNGMFKLVAVGGSYQFVNVATGRALAFSGSSAKSGVKIVTKKAKKSDKTQLFTVEARDGLLKGGVYTVKTKLKGSRSLSPKSGSLKADATAALATSTGTLAQRWQVKAVSGKKNVYTIEDLATGYHLAASGSKAVLKSAASSTEQMWKAIGANGTVMFQNVKTGKVLQPSRGKSAAGTAVVLAKKSSATKQRWTLSSASAMGSGVYELDSSAKSTIALEVSGASTASDAAVQVNADDNGIGQRWAFDESTGTFTSVNSGMVLTVKGGSAKAGAALVQEAYTGAKTQQWKVSYLGGGKFRIASAANSSYVVGISGTSNGAAAKLLGKDGGSSTQTWHIIQAQGNATTYDSLGFSVEQMARWQKANNPYLSGYTISYLKSVIDPANGSKYKFLDLRKLTGVSASSLDKFINTNGSNGMLKGLGSAFVSAAKKYNLNEVYLVAHAILESGWGTSTLAKGYKYSGGYIDGKYYKKGTYYNFYGIGAYDSSPLSGGRKMAIINGWNTPEKAVTGAAKWIASNYVYASSYAQTTVYSMKWDLARTKAIKGYGWHQYATSTTWADSIGKLMGQAFTAAKKSAGFSFIIPKYK